MAAGRPKNFCRDEVLQKALPVFWERGFASTSLADLEQATGVNKSGLYAEFENKDDLYIECIKHYSQSQGGAMLLSAQPLGWGNIENFFKRAYYGECGQKGCFAVSSIRDLANISAEARAVLANGFEVAHAAILQNIKAEQTTMDAKSVADVAVALFFGFCVELGLDPKKAAVDRKIKNCMRALRSL